jgi:predicted flap endonuclease-1-like 5' DNA nuclease
MEGCSGWCYFILGLLLGWLIEWVIDYLFWRKKRTQVNANVTSQITPPAAPVVVAANAAPAAVLAAVAAVAVASVEDDLQRIEGIGPKISGLLKADGIMTFAKLAITPTSTISAILEKAGPRYKLANPETWPEQAALAAKGEWAALEKLQDELDGGVRVPGYVPSNPNSSPQA